MPHPRRDAALSAPVLVGFAMAALAPMYVGIAVGRALPQGGFRDLGGWVTGLVVVVVPLAWLLVADLLAVTMSRAARALAPSAPRPAVEFACEAVAAAVFIALLMTIFEHVVPALVATVVARLLYAVAEPWITRGESLPGPDA